MRTTLRYAAPRPPQTDGWRAECYALRAQIGEFLRRKQAAAAERLQAAAAEREEERDIDATSDFALGFSDIFLF